MKIRNLIVIMAATAAMAFSVPAAARSNPAGIAREPAARHYQNCTKLNHVYPHGVGKPGAKDHVSGNTRPVTNFKVSAPLYNANSGSDRDGDKVACEKL